MTLYSLSCVLYIIQCFTKITGVLFYLAKNVHATAGVVHCPNSD